MRISRTPRWLALVASIALVVPLVGLPAGPGPAIAQAASCPPPLTSTTGPLPEGPGAIAGTVENAEGSPLEGILVQVALLGSGSTGSTTVPTGTDGSWAVTGLGAGSYRIGYIDTSGTYQRGFYAATGLVVDPAASTTVQVVDALVAGIDVVLPAARTVTISGRVIGPNNDEPVAGVAIAIDGQYLSGWSGCVWTDVDGTFSREVAAGTYVLVLRSDAPYPDGYYRDEAPGNFTPAFGLATVIVADTADLTIDVQLPPTYAITGTAVDGVGSDRVEGVSIQACLADDPASCPAGASSAADGTFSLDRLVAGNYLLRIGDTPGGIYRTGFVAADGVTQDPTEALRFAVSGNLEGVEVILQGKPVLAGLVTSPDGSPVPDVEVAACDGASGMCGIGTTGVDGRYVVPVDPGSYTLRFGVIDPTTSLVSGYYGPADLGLPVALRMDPSDARAVAVGDDDVSGLDIVLPMGYRISGNTAEWIGVDVCLDETTCVASTGSDGSGLFATPPLLPGAYYLGAYHATMGRLWYLGEVLVTADFATAAQIVLAGADVAVQFNVPDQTPVGADVSVGFVNPETEASLATLTFASVTDGGTTTLTVYLEEPPEPIAAGFQVGDPPTWFEIDTTAVFTEVEVCISYAGIAFADEAHVSLLHFVNGAWWDVTTSRDPVTDIVCGITTSFSPFAVVQADPPAWSFSGFYAPVDNPPVLNTAKAGSAIPVKFGLGGDFGLDILAAGSPYSVRTPCDRNLPADAVETTAGRSQSGLTYDAATDRYTYVWKTERSWAGTCRTFVLELADGTTKEAWFSFVR